MLRSVYREVRTEIRQRPNMKAGRKVNLGSGTSIADGWINIDKSWNIYLSRHKLVKGLLYKLKLISQGTFEADWQGKHVARHDITKGLPFEDGSIDCVYCSHVLEHLTREEALGVCKEVYRVLKRKGLFRVVVPDLKLLARKYVEGNKKFFEEGHRSRESIADLFLKSLNLEGLRKRALIERILYSEHKWMYDFESLTFLLELASFRTIQKSNFREGLCPDLQVIENRMKSIYVEAYK